MSEVNEKGKESAVARRGRSGPRRDAAQLRKERGRFSSRRKSEAVLRLLRGEDLDTVSRELGVTAGTLASWRDDFLAAGQMSLRSRPSDERDQEIQRLRSKVGELTMENELLYERCHRMEDNLPLAHRRRRR